MHAKRQIPGGAFNYDKADREHVSALSCVEFVSAIILCSTCTVQTGLRCGLDCPSYLPVQGGRGARSDLHRMWIRSAQAMKKLCLHVG